MSPTASPAQAFIARLAERDPARPRLDKAAASEAAAAYLAAVGLPDRPVFFAEDARSGFSRVRRNLLDAGSGAQAKGGRIGAALERQTPDLAEKLVGWRFEETRATAECVGPEIRADFRAVDPWRSTKEAAEQEARTALHADAWNAAWNAARYAAFESDLRAVRQASRQRGRASREASLRAEAAAHIVWRDAEPLLDAALAALGDLHALAAFPPRTCDAARLETIWRPSLAAFEAGLLAALITAGEVVCIPHPALALSGGLPHRTDGAAVIWPTGEAYYFWRGVEVPGRFIVAPGSLTVRAIGRERNQELRRSMLEIYGLSRFLRDAGARRIHADSFGTLWRLRIGEETWRFVEVTDGTPGPDGSRRLYVLDVTDAESVLGWPIRTARAAVAATYGLRPDAYFPEVRT